MKSMDLKTALWAKEKYIEYKDEVSAFEPYLTKPPKPSDPYAIQCLYPSEEEIKKKARYYCSKNIENFTYTMVWEYKPSSTEPFLRARCDIPWSVFHCNVEDYKKQLFDVLVYKVQQYYKDKKKVEETKMHDTFGSSLRNDMNTYGNDLLGRLRNDIYKLSGYVEAQYESLSTFDVPRVTLKINMPASEIGKLVIKPDELVTKTDSKETKSKTWIEGLPAVKKVETYNDRVVKVTFIDDTFTKSICSENDHFDLDVGITICAMKRIFGEHGTREYNRFIEHAHDAMARNEKQKEAEKAAKEAEKVKRRKAELKKVAKELRAKETYIRMHKEAYLRAMKECEEDDLK